MKREFVAQQGERIDKVIGSEFGDITRSYAQKLLEQQLVCVEGKVVKANFKCKIGQLITVDVPAPVALDVAAEDIPLDVVYEDAHLLVVNKPQGMVVHPAAGNHSGTLVNALMQHCGDSLSHINGVVRPGIVHRIDKDTSGLLLVAKDNEAHLGLSAQIKAHTLTRKYIALVHGSIKADHGTIEKPIGRSLTDRKKMSATAKVARHAVTHYAVLARFAGYTFVECTLETGRTHQIRVHMASIGHPVLGDQTYGVKKEKYKLSGQLLHAKLLGFVHPITGEYLELETDIPQRFLPFLKDSYK